MSSFGISVIVFSLETSDDIESIRIGLEELSRFTSMSETKEIQNILQINNAKSRILNFEWWDCVSIIRWGLRWHHAFIYFE